MIEEQARKHSVIIELGKNFFIFFIGIFTTGLVVLTFVGVSKHADVLTKLAGLSGGSSLLSAMLKDFLKSRREQQEFIHNRREEVDKQFEELEEEFKAQTQELWLTLRTHENSPGHEKLMQRVSVLERMVARLKGQVTAFSQSGRMLDEIREIKEQNSSEVSRLKTQHQELMTRLDDIGDGYDSRIENLETQLAKLREDLTD